MGLALLALFAAQCSSQSVCLLQTLTDPTLRSVHVGPTRIPCVVHQTWKTHQLSDRQNSCVDTWKSKNPTCEHRLWNDTEIAALCKEKSPDLIWPIWDGLSPVERADVFRYLVLWNQGGYYADIDVQCRKPVAEFPVLTPFERSRSKKGGPKTAAPSAAIMPRSEAARFSHRGFEFAASREGLPVGSHHLHVSRTEINNIESTQVNNTLNINQSQSNQVLVNAHDPAITHTVEELAEARHREAFAHTEGKAQMMVSEMNQRFRAEEQAASTRMHQMMMLAEGRENQFREEMSQQTEVYERIVDGNARQSNATKEQQLNQLKSYYERQDQERRNQMLQLENIIRQQSEQLLIQQRQTQSMSMQFKTVMESIGPVHIPIVETATATLPTGTEVKITGNLAAFDTAPPTAAGATASGSVAPPTEPPPGDWQFVGLKKPPDAEHFDLGTDVIGLVSSTYPSTSIAESNPGDDRKKPDKPNDDDPTGDDEDKGSNKKDKKDNAGKKPQGRGNSPPGGGPGDDDGGDDDWGSDASDKRFIRRMKRMFGSSKDSQSDQSTVKEADTIKIPAFPHAESYRNWRVRTREAVMSASTDPDKAFDWISETWAEGRMIEKLKDVGKFTTLDAKLLSALYILIGDFARKVDTYKEVQASNKKYVRGRQVLFMMHDHFSTNIKHGATYALQDLFSVKLKGDSLRGFISSWDQVIAGIPKIPDISVLETLFFNQEQNSKAIAHDLQEYHSAEDGTDKKSYDFLVAAVRRYLDREGLESNRERVARNLSAHLRALLLHLVTRRVCEVEQGFLHECFLPIQA
eukprot:s659_g33.t1